MALLQEEINLDSDENIIALFRPHSFYVWLWSSFLSVFLFFVFLFMFKMIQSGIIGIALFVIMISFLLFLLASRVVGWYGTVTVLTNRRLLCIRRYGLLKKTVTEVLLHNITELSYSTKGMFQTIFQFGTIYLSLHPANTRFTLSCIPLPQEVMDIISFHIAKNKSTI